jgi:hypothetical protein
MEWDGTGAWQPWGGTISLSNARIGSMHGIGRHEDLTVLYLDNNRCGGTMAVR